MDYKTVLDHVESLDGENSDLYLETVEQNLLVRHRSAGEKMQSAEADGFYTISVVKRRIVYRTFLESAKEADDTEEFATRVEDFYTKVRSKNREAVEELERILTDVLSDPLQEVK